MTFLYPFYFWILLGLIPLVAVYFLKVRPRKKPTTAFFLWQHLFDQKRSSSLFEKLRDLLSLLLMLLAFSAIVLALTAPQLTDDQRKDILILIDNSASMNTHETGRTRIEKAKGIANGIIRNLNTNQQAAVASVSLDIRYHSHFTTSPRTLIDAVSQIEPSDCPFRVKALDFMAIQGATESQYRIILLSDGCSMDSNLPDYVELLKVGSNQDNVGITACDLQYIEGINDQLQLYFQTASTAKQTIKADLLVQYSSNRITNKLIPLEIEPGTNKPQTYTIYNAQPGMWTVQVDYKDALDTDNTVSLVVPPRRQIRIAVDSNETYFLKQSILAFSKTSGDLLLSDSQPDIILATGSPAAQGRSIVFSPLPSQGWWGRFSEPLENIIPHIIIEKHPLLEHCDISAIPFAGARDVHLPADNLVLVENTEHVPLIYRVRDSNNSAVIVNINLRDSDFYYSAWFPVLVYNAARHLMGESGHILSAYVTGSVVPVSIALQDEKTTVTMGNDKSFIEHCGSEYGPVRMVGHYTFSNSTGQQQFGTGLLNESETMINNDNISDTSRPINSGLSPSVLLGTLALLILPFECVLYHRRKVG
jgi:hypothetical protein